jgi:predicted NBD/HSP70 family sugar kinase
MVLRPDKMGRINKRALLARLQRVGLGSRAELAKSLGLSQPTAGKIADELLRIGVLEEVEGPGDPSRRAASGIESRSKLGRPGRMLRLNRRRPRFLAIQLGVFETGIAALPVGVDPEDHWTVRVKTPDSAEQWVNELSTVASRFPEKQFWGALLSAPGIVDEQAGRVLFSPNLHWTESADLPGLVRRVWNIPVAIVQEERALALGHQFVHGAAEDFLLVDFGEGVGGAAIVGGKLYSHPLPLSGELGHTPVLGNQRPCGCGAVGCVETLVSTRGLLQSYAAAHPGMDATWVSLAEHIEKNGLESWLAQTLDSAAVVIAGALNVLGLQNVTITGSLVELPHSVMDHLTQAVVKGSMWARFGKVTVETAPRRRSAGLVAIGIDRLVMKMRAGAEYEDAGSAEFVSYAEV